MQVILMAAYNAFLSDPVSIKVTMNNELKIATKRSIDIGLLPGVLSNEFTSNR